MIELTWSPRSAADLEEIRNYIAADSPSYADLTVRRLVAAAERLRQFPELGRVVPERESIELREIITGRFRIVYRRRDDVVEIVTVFRVLDSFRTLRHRSAADPGVSEYRVLSTISYADTIYDHRDELLLNSLPFRPSAAED